MADPLNTLKPLDRLKPFRRINNDVFRPADDEKPDGKGVACGCHNPNQGQFKDLDAEFKKFLQDPANTKILGSALQLIDKVHAASKAIAEALTPIVAALASAALLLGSALGPFAPVISLLSGVLAALKVVNDFVDAITKAIDDAIHEFLATLGGSIARRAIRMIPQWVPVKKGASNQAVTADQIKEVEGIVTRSYGDPIESPFFQWHHWLNWSFQVKPEDRYKNLLVVGFKPDPNAIDSGEQPIVKQDTFEVQWDSGAMFSTNTGKDLFGKGFEETEMPDVDGPMVGGVSEVEVAGADGKKQTVRRTRDSFWIWPMTGMYAWASGRWVYDCSKTDSLTSADPKMCSMMTPPRAVATACWEARQFSENLSSDPNKENLVPAIRFMFFSSTRGGYLDTRSISDEDYEFILDLPPIVAPATPFPIGHTFAHNRAPSELPDFPHNTLVIRPRLLRELQPLGPDPADQGLIKPIIQVLPAPPDDAGNPAPPGTPPKQVLITIRGSDIAKARGGAAGFILSLGWLDPNRTQAATVKKCNVAFNSLAGRLSVDRDSPKQLLDKLFPQRARDKIKRNIKDEVEKLKLLPLPPPIGSVSINDLINNKLPDPADKAVKAVGNQLKDIVEKAVDKGFDAAIKGLTDVIAKSQSEEWLLRAGVNGRWQSRFFGNLEKGAFALKDPYQFTIPLGPDDLLFYSSGGVEFNPVGDMMRAPKAERVLKGANKNVLTWDEIVNATGADLRNLVFDYTLKVLVGNSASQLALGIENTPLGIKDPGDFASPGDDPATSNPLRMKQVQPGSTQIQPVAKFAKASDIEKECILEEDSQDDYKLTGLIQIAKQNSDT